jgi:site-specific DNA-methyltransferase (adenine-specific)
MNTEVMFSSETDLWSTPQTFYDELAKEFDFKLDVCSDGKNYKCLPTYTKLNDGLAQNWDYDSDGGWKWMNPPYGREIGLWIKKAKQEGKTVCLLPARTDTKWFHEYIYGKAEIRFIKGRLKFGDSKNYAPFPSMIVIFK